MRSFVAKNFEGDVCRVYCEHPCLEPHGARRTLSHRYDPPDRKKVVALPSEELKVWAVNRQRGAGSAVAHVASTSERRVHRRSAASANICAVVVTLVVVVVAIVRQHRCTGTIPVRITSNRVTIRRDGAPNGAWHWRDA